MLHKDRIRLPSDVVDACTNFRQGDVVEGIVASFTAHRDRPLTDESESRVSGQTDEFVVVPVSLPYAIITAQTCDVQNAKRMLFRPFLSVARVVDAVTEFDDGRLGHIRKGRFGDLIPLTGAAFAAKDGLWVADLRLESSVE